MNDEWIQKMTTYKALFNRAFFQCRECEFVWTVLGQANHEMEGGCPSCGEFDFDYAPKAARDNFIRGVKDELEMFEQGLKEEG